MSQARTAQPPNTYVLKTYNTKDAVSYYENEVRAFRRLATRDHNDRSLVQYLGSFKHSDTYNILLEYADGGTLEDFFQNISPPSLAEHMILFWERLFDIFKALSRIHATELSDGCDGPYILIG